MCQGELRFDCVRAASSIVSRRILFAFSISSRSSVIQENRTTKRHFPWRHTHAPIHQPTTNERNVICCSLSTSYFMTAIAWLVTVSIKLQLNKNVMKEQPDWNWESHDRNVHIATDDRTGSETWIKWIYNKWNWRNKLHWLKITRPLSQIEFRPIERKCWLNFVFVSALQQANSHHRSLSLLSPPPTATH